VLDIDKERLANLTPTAERLTATSSGFNGNTNVANPYGGFLQNMRHARLVDVVQVFAIEVYDQGSDTAHSRHDTYTSWPWRSTWMQSVTDEYDNQDHLTPALGFKHKGVGG
jgi:hypothetical protein